MTIAIIESANNISRSRAIINRRGVIQGLNLVHNNMRLRKHFKLPFNDFVYENFHQDYFDYTAVAHTREYHEMSLLNLIMITIDLRGEFYSIR